MATGAIRFCAIVLVSVLLRAQQQPHRMIVHIMTTPQHDSFV
jgi:hypothetical protein